MVCVGPTPLPPSLSVRENFFLKSWMTTLWGRGEMGYGKADYTKGLADTYSTTNKNASLQNYITSNHIHKLYIGLLYRPTHNSRLRNKSIRTGPHLTSATSRTMPSACLLRYVRILFTCNCLMASLVSARLSQSRVSGMGKEPGAVAPSLELLAAGSVSFASPPSPWSAA